jgi:glycosyltransferase involved in cell wall biosynthesis
MVNKILVEGTALYERKSGIGNYTKNLIEFSAKQNKRKTFVIFSFLFFHKRPLPRPFLNIKNIKYQYIRYFPGKLYAFLLNNNIAPNIGRLLNSKKSVYIFPNFIKWPIGNRNKSISFIYDLSFVQFPEYADPKTYDFLKSNINQTIDESNRIITISYSSKRQIEKYNKNAKGKIDVVNPAIDHGTFNRKSKYEIDKVLKKYGIKNKYILFIGNIEPRKNITGILDSYSSLKEIIKSEYGLVLAGGGGWQNDKIEIKLKDMSNLNIVCPGYIDEEDMPALYSGASLFIFPSHYEGWGMPVLEAMACGVPVVTSNNSSLPEVAGDAAIMVDADDTKKITSSMELVLRNNKLKKEMIIKGYSQAKKFSWEKSAKLFNNIIDEELNR